MDNYKCTTGIFRGLAIAFDNIDHNILMKKLTHDIHGVFSDWIHKNFAFCQRYIYLNEIMSDLQPITYGIPPGFIHGPKYLIIGLNDIGIVLQILDFILYVDDTHKNLTFRC